MISIYKDGVKDLLYPKKGNITKHKDLIIIEKPQSYSASQVRKLRRFLQLSQGLFAEVMGVSLATVVAWENGANYPSPASCRLMDMLAINPDILLECKVIEFKS
ncbi:MAG: hypothetical protein IJ836_00440 [Spirochaetales bacterium]|nr:hypothetical protein [Spirochaetales bacterium]